MNDPLFQLKELSEPVFFKIEDFNFWHPMILSAKIASNSHFALCETITYLVLETHYMDVSYGMNDESDIIIESIFIEMDFKWEGSRLRYRIF